MTFMLKSIPFSLLIFIVYLFSISLRLILAWQTADSSLHILDGEYLSILTHDASHYGYYAKLLLSGLPHNSDVHSIEYLIYYLVKFTPLSLDEVMYFAPAFLSTLIIIPTMLLASLYIRSKTILVILGLVSGVGYGYYSRTYLGYFDTDVLNNVFPMFMIYGMVLSLKTQVYYSLWITILSSILYASWYQASMPLIFALYGNFILYILIVYYSRITFSKKILYYFLTTLLILAIALFLIDFTFILKYLHSYVFKSAFIALSDFKFVAPMQHLAEAKSTSLFFIAKLISGNILIFILSSIGYILLIVKHKEMIVTLPMVLLGLLSIYSGIRFHIYATTLFVLSYFFLLFYLIDYFKAKKYLAMLIILLFSLPSLYENGKIIDYWNSHAKPVFTPEQVKALKHLEEISTTQDYAITWWDFGGATLYYSGLKTMINNAIHHADNYTVANILLSDSAKFTNHASHYFYDLFDKHKSNAIYRGLKKHPDSEILFDHIENNYIPSKKSLEKYIILPSQLAPLIYTMYVFANIDPLSGEKISNHIFKKFKKIREDKKFVYFEDNSKIDKYKSILYSQNKNFPIKNISIIRYKNNKKEVRHTRVSAKGLHLIAKNNYYYIMDDYFYDSIVVQMLFFNNYDKKYFAPIYEGKTISIYKVK